MDPLVPVIQPQKGQARAQQLVHRDPHHQQFGKIATRLEAGKPA